MGGVTEFIKTADFETPLGRVRIASSKRGLVHLGFPLATGRGFSGWRERFAPGSRIVRDQDANEEFVGQVHEFIDGTRRHFEVPVDLRATPFQQRVFKVVSEIDWGQTQSYKDVALALGDEHLVRAVGTAVGANPLALVIPCHRVVGARGKLQGYAGGVEVKAKLLAAEQSGPESGRLF